LATVPITDQVEDTTSVFQSNLPIDEKLDRARTEQLDLSARNRLLNMPSAAKGTKAVEIVDEVSAEVFRLLVNDGRPFTFLRQGRAIGDATDEEVSADDADEIENLAQPDDGRC